MMKLSSKSMKIEKMNANVITNADLQISCVLSFMNFTFVSLDMCAQFGMPTG